MRIPFALNLFPYHQLQLYCEGVPLVALAAEFGTPLYVYSANTVRAQYRRLAAAFAPLQPQICYAVKANGNLSLLQLLREAGAGFDIVSGGELYRALAAGADASRIVFAGVGKTDAELVQGLEANVGWFNVESADELLRLNTLAAARGQTATVALRLNPGVAPDTHHHISTGGARSKFGLPVAEARALLRRAADFPALNIAGLHIHIGSQMAAVQPTLQAMAVALDLMQEFSALTTLDLGGGFPVQYQPTGAHASIEEFAALMIEKLQPFLGRWHFHLEPGRYLVANSAVLLTQVQAIKIMDGQRVVVVDTGMHHLLRPALYESQHEILPLSAAPPLEAACVVAGPICESTDVLARNRFLPELKPGDYLAIADVGAYGMSMASNYNAHPRPAEVLVDGRATRLIRRRETYADLVAHELTVI
ncbi:MAG: diaminopimelate decarboxylase [Anaerolineales bacterium]|nr:diaminopimelate decarboxylase [Anaerolineales bacterium]